MVLYDELSKPLEQVLTFSFRKAVDMLDMMANREDRLPPSHGISANKGMLRHQVAAGVLWRAAWFAV
jgi:hypothetical protein